MANVRKLMRLARDYEANEGRDLAGFLALAAESTRRDEREGMAAVQAEGHDGVRVMTVHAAKGLRVPGRRRSRPRPRAQRRPPARRHRDRRRPRDDGERRFGMRLAFPSAGSVGLWELVDLNTAESEAEAEEGCRLVYVAASRAEDRLILSGLYKPADLEPAEERKPNDTPLRRLLPALAERGFAGADGEVELPGPLPVDGSRRACRDARLRDPGQRAGAEARRRARAQRSRRPPRTTRCATRRASRRRCSTRARRRCRSATSPTRRSALYEGCGYRFYVERVLGAREALAPAPATRRPTSRPDPRPSWSSRASTAASRSGSATPSTRRSSGAPAAAGSAAGRSCSPTCSPARASPATPRRAAARRAAGRRLARLRAARRARRGAAAGRGPVRRSTSARRSSAARSTCSSPRGDGVPTVVDYKTDALDGRSAGRARRAATRPSARSTRSPPAAARRSARGPRLPRGARRSGDRGVRPRAPRRRREPAGGDWSSACAAGEFEVTENPYAALCFGCPAAAGSARGPQWKPPP